MSSPAIQSTIERNGREGVTIGGVAPSSRSGVKAVAPIVVASIALMIHELVPNRQSSPTSRFYPSLLAAFLLASIAVFVAQAKWRRLRPWASHFCPLFAGAIAWLAAWDLITLKTAWMELPYFPGPDLVLQGLWEDRELLLESTWHSLLLLLSGYALGAVAGLICGVLIGWFRPLRYWAMPALRLLGPIPATAFVPLVITMFSDAFLSGSALIALAVWFPVAMLTCSGITNVPISYMDVAKTLGAGRAYLIFRVAIPAAMPSIFLGLFMGLIASFLTLIVAETVGVPSGLGFYLKWQQGYVEYAKVYGAIAIMAVFFSGLMTLLFKVRDRVMGWREGLIRW